MNLAPAPHGLMAAFASVLDREEAAARGAFWWPMEAERVVVLGSREGSARVDAYVVGDPDSDESLYRAADDPDYLGLFFEGDAERVEALRQKAYAQGAGSTEAGPLSGATPELQEAIRAATEG